MYLGVSDLSLNKVGRGEKEEEEEEVWEGDRGGNARILPEEKPLLLGFGAGVTWNVPSAV